MKISKFFQTIKRSSAYDDVTPTYVSTGKPVFKSVTQAIVRQIDHDRETLKEIQTQYASLQQ